MRRMPPKRVLLALALLAACSSENNKNPKAPGGDGDGDGDQTSDAGDSAPDGGDDEPLEPEPAGTERTLELFDAVRLSSIAEDEHFQSAEADFDFGAGPFAKVTFIVDLDTTCFPFSKWQTNQPPTGHNYPADCDAFDRNFEFTMDEPKKEGDPPAFELIRSITPFGGPLHMEVDLTDLANAQPGKHTVKTFIATWSDAMGMVTGSKGGWNVSARIELLTGKAPRKVLAAIPLANLSLDNKAPKLDAPFTLPEGTSSMRLEVRTTGHGGGTDPEYCFGPAEEFCNREHTFEIDGKLLAKKRIVREDCAMLCTRATQGTGENAFEYCEENPFGLIASVEAARAGWCPGELVPPQTFELEVKGGGKPHTLSYGVPHIAEGGSLRTSATVYAFGPE
jgi:hypothetical protein